jgi:phosphoribosylformylglycinamidine synthase
MWQFSEAIDGIAEACDALEVPITGGNVSFYNETLGKAIYPTPVIGVLGILEDSSKALGLAFRNEGDVIILLDGAAAAEKPIENLRREFSSSEYAKTIHGIVAGEPPAIELAAEKRLQDCLVALATDGAIESAHDVSDGGLAVSLAESSFASDGLAAQVALDGTEPDESALFGERGARAVASVRTDSLARVAEVAAKYSVSAQSIGKAVRGDFRIEYRGSLSVRGTVQSLHDSWSRALEKALR